MTCASVSLSCGTLFDIPSKIAERDRLTNRMGEPTFWDNQDNAKKTIQALKPLNGLIKPYDELRSAVGDLEALAELAQEDGSLEGELVGEVDKAERLYDRFELMAMMSGNSDFETLLEEDMATLLQGDGWWPFPYIVSHASLMRLSPLTGTKSRPLCVSGGGP